MTLKEIQEREALERWFTYHAPTDAEIASYKEIRTYAKHLAEVILTECPPNADRTAALRKVREAVMTANASIACRDRSRKGL